jgi:hypothetical protein
MDTIIITPGQLTAAADWAVAGPDMAQVTLRTDDNSVLHVSQGDDGTAFAADTVFTEPRPARAALLAFAADVLACAPDDEADPSSLDTEALAGLALHARQLLAGEPTPYDQSDGQATAQLPGARALLARIKQVEEPDGSWPGGDVVDVLTDYFTRLGLDIESREGTRWADDDQEDDDDA